MKRRIRLTEGQLYRLIEQVMMFENHKRMLTESQESVLDFISKPTTHAHINDPSELDEYFGDEPFYNYLSQELKNKVKSGDLVVSITYTDYHGTTVDKAIIEYFKTYNPNNIVSTTLSYDGQVAYIFGDDNFIDSEVKDAIWDYRPEMERETAYEEADRIVNDYHLQLDPNQLGELADFLEENGHPEPNYIDISDDEIEDFLEEQGWLNESLAHRVTEGIIRKLRRA